MSSLTKNVKSISKKDLIKNRTAPIASRNVVFYHKADSGDLSINLLSLTMPSAELPTQTQATVHEINSAKLLFNRKNLKLRSLSKGELVQGLDYVVTSSYDIQLIGVYEGVGTEPDEIFEGVISSTPASDLVVASAKSITKTYELPVGQTTLNLGNEYQVGVNPNDEVGIIKVWINGVLGIRGQDYDEVDSGNGFGSTIEFLDAPTINPYKVVVDYGVMSITDNNAMGAIENLAGSLSKIANDLSVVAGTSPSDYFNASPSEVERRAFGDKVLELDGKFDTAQNLSEYTKTKYQVKILGANLTTSGAVAALSFNNLTIGKTYRFVAQVNGDHNGVAGSVNLGFTFTNGATSIGRVYNKDTSGQEEWSDGTESVFVATASVITSTLERAGGRILGDGTLYGTYVILEELPNHEQTTQWT